MKKIVVAVDGPAGSGKSITFQKVAEKLNYKFIDTGLMYRAFTFLGLQKKINFDSKKEIIALIPFFDYRIKNNKIYLNGENVTQKLQSRDIILFINKVTIIPEVRTMMVKRQRKLVSGGGVIEIGRDITSVVLPNADLKIYLDSSIAKRAQRRYEQNLAQGICDMSLEEIHQAIAKRDEIDKSRVVGPLKLIADAWYIDNSNLTIEQTVDLVVNKVQNMEKE